YIVQEAKNAKHCVLMIGTARQLLSADAHNAYKNGNGSFLPAFQYLVDQINKEFNLNIEFDTYMLEDDFAQQPSGTTVKKISAALVENDAKLLKYPPAYTAPSL